ncbi:MAG TPA: response regulator [Azospirillaceae bacterium]|nr:response regulator [Azospirillaceae bacterium]
MLIDQFTAPSPPVEGSQPAPHVLVVDDECILALALKACLGRSGYRVSTAGDGVRALEIAALDPVDVLVTDLRMPRMGGAELVQRFQALSPGVPVVVLTGYPPDAAAIVARGEVPLTVLDKPADPLRVHQVLTRLLSAGLAAAPGNRLPI